MKAGVSMRRDIPFMLVLFITFVFTPFRTIRIVLLLFLLVILVSKLHSRLVRSFVDASRVGETIRAGRFEAFTVKMEVRNRGPFPINSLILLDRTGGLYTAEPASFLLSLEPGEKKLVSYPAEGHERGEFSLGPLELRGSNALGFSSWEKLVPAPLKVIVYPSVHPLGLTPEKGLPSGNLKVHNRLYEDVTRFRSLREYTPGDEMKRINWKVSAKLGKLYSMEYMPSIYFPTLIVLNLTDDDYPPAHKQQIVERAIETAASLIFHFVGLKQDVGLVTTGNIPGREGFPTVPIKAGYGHAVNVLEILARIKASSERMDFVQGIFRSGVSIHGGTKIMVVTPPLREEQKSSLLGMRRKGYDMEVFIINSSAVKAEETVLAGIRSHAIEEYGEELVHE